jgi:hypothetical protein
LLKTYFLCKNKAANYRKKEYSLNEQQYDQYLNIETEGYQQGYPKQLDYHRYEPTPYKALDQLFNEYELPQRAVCVDIGCGKGRVPIYLHEKFRVMTKGIEMDPKFFAAAEYNLQQYKMKHRLKAGSVEFYHQLGEEYEVQKQDNVFFFFNPFSIHIFRRVLNNIIESYEQNPRELHFIFYYPSPEYIDFLLNYPILKLQQEVRLNNVRNINERIIIFTT